jgi:hypothetical protein
MAGRRGIVRGQLGAGGGAQDFTSTIMSGVENSQQSSTSATMTAKLQSNAGDNGVSYFQLFRGMVGEDDPGNNNMAGLS